MSKERSEATEKNDREVTDMVVALMQRVKETCREGSAINLLILFGTDDPIDIEPDKPEADKAANGFGFTAGSNKGVASLLNFFLGQNEDFHKALVFEQLSRIIEKAVFSDPLNKEDLH